MKTHLRTLTLILSMLAALSGAAGTTQAAGQAPQVGEAIVHTVRSGDTLFLLSQTYGVTNDSIRATNPAVLDWSVLRPGAQLVIPVARSFTPSVTTPFFYVVQPGETSTTIAKKFEVDHLALARANGSRFYPFTVAAGQTILIPAGPHLHIVRPGETLDGIALAFGTNSGVLARANSLTTSDRVFVGQQIVIPFQYNARPLAPGGAPITGAPLQQPSTALTTPVATPTRIPTARPSATPIRSTAGTSGSTSNTPGSTGGPLEYRMIFVETMDLDPSRFGGAVARMRLEFRGGRPPFTLFSDDMLVGTNLFPGWRLDFGVIYSTLRYDQLTTCGAVITHTIKLISADGQILTQVYFIGPFSCPPATVLPFVTRTPGP